MDTNSQAGNVTVPVEVLGFFIHANDPRKKLGSYREAAQLLSLWSKTAWSLLASGQLNPVRIGRRTLVVRTTLDAFIADLQRNGGAR